MLKIMRNIRVQTKKNSQEVDDMELLRVKRNFQVTIPQAIRDKIRLAVGDYVEAEIEDDVIVIRPVKGVRSGEPTRRMTKARQAAYAALDEIWEKMKDEDPDEIENAISEAVKAARNS